jgi:hypothetical protein
MTEQCPLCGEDIQVGTAGLQGLAQHRGKKKCLATVKKKQQDTVMTKEPTLFLYLRRQDTTLPTTTDLTREAERKQIESSSRVVVSQVAIPKAIPMTYTADQDAQCQGDNAEQSTDLGLDSDVDLELGRALDQDACQDELFTWSTEAGEWVGSCEPWARSTTPNNIQDMQNVHGTQDRPVHETVNA